VAYTRITPIKVPTNSKTAARPRSAARQPTTEPVVPPTIFVVDPGQSGKGVKTATAAVFPWMQPGGPMAPPQLAGAPRISRKANPKKRRKNPIGGYQVMQGKTVCAHCTTKPQAVRVATALANSSGKTHGVRAAK
jgi:hypothetical protein